MTGPAITASSRCVPENDHPCQKHEGANVRAEAINPETGETIVVELTGEQVDALRSLRQERVSDDRLSYYIDQLNISADAKALLGRILQTTIRVGQTVIRIGKRIIEAVLAIVSQFPHTTFGAILGLVVGTLVASVPILGILFGGLLVPIGVAFGLVAGYREDLRDKELQRKIQEATGQFSPLRGVAQ